MGFCPGCAYPLSAAHDCECGNRDNLGESVLEAGCDALQSHRMSAAKRRKIMPANRVEPAKCGGGELSDLSAGVEMGVLWVVITLSLRKNTSRYAIRKPEDTFMLFPYVLSNKPADTGLGSGVMHAIVTRKSATQPLPTLHSSLGTWAGCSIAMAQVHPLPASPGEASRLLL